MFEWIASVFGYVMKFIYELVQNYGVAIILFTFLIKLLLLPFMIKQQKSMDKMKELQPLYQELQRKYGNDNARFAEEYQKLLKEKNMSMSSSMGCGGCLLSIIQLPIVLGLFYMMVNPLTYILKLPEEQINEYKQNLNTYYAEQAIEAASTNGKELTSGEIEVYMSGDYLANTRYYELVIAKQENLFNMDFLGINLGDIAAENKTNYVLYIMPVLCMVATYLALKISTADAKNATKTKEIAPNNDEKNLTKPNEEIPMPDMSFMNFMMPIMTGYIAFIAPQGLGLYWATNNILQLAQIVGIKKFKKEKNA